MRSHDVGGGRARAAESGPIGYALARAARAQRAVLQARLAPLGLHLGQELLIVDLAENPRSTQGEVVSRLGIEQPTVAKSVGRLERAGFITRSADTDDRRVVRLDLTAAGHDVVAGVLAAWTAADAVAAAGLTETERRTLVRLLARIADAHDQEDG